MVIHRSVIPESYTDDVLRRIHLDVAENGIDAAALREWATTTAFPHLRFCDEMIELRDYMQAAIMDGLVDWAEPQIIYRYPDAAESWPIAYHVDLTNEGEQFGGIYAVPLTRSWPRDGCLMIPQDEGVHVFVRADVGDVINLLPSTPHASGLNRGGRIRAAVYFRHF